MLLSNDVNSLFSFDMILLYLIAMFILSGNGVHVHMQSSCDFLYYVVMPIALAIMLKSFKSPCICKMLI